MTEHLETVTIVAIEAVISTYPCKSSFVLDNAVYFILRKAVAGIQISEIQRGWLGKAKRARQYKQECNEFLHWQLTKFIKKSVPVEKKTDTLTSHKNIFYAVLI